MRLALLFLVACGHPAATLLGDASPTTDATATTGLRAAYYSDAVDQSVDQIDPTVDLTTADDNLAVRWTGTITPPVPGDYAFAIDTDAGARLWIDSTKLIDVWSDGAHTTDFTPVTISGPVAIKVTYYHRTGAAHMQLRWRRPDGTEEVVPQSALQPDPSVVLASPPPPYTNSVDLSGCADPGALAVDGTYYLACTSVRFRIHTSRDLVTWKATDHYILPEAGPSWSSSNEYRWAPEIHPVGSKYVAYFTASDGSGQRAIGCAAADSPLGPYTLQTAPLVTNPIGVIDPTFFADDDGKQYLIWKVAGNSSGKPTPILLRQLTANGLAFAPGSTAIQLITNDPSTYEGAVVEAPWMLKRNGMYYLFYSANYINENYRVGVARATSVTGAYTKHSGPILGNSTKWLGPGHNSSVQVDGIDYLVYHAWRATTAGALDETLGRVLMIDRIDWVGGWPQIDGDGKPSQALRPRPGIDPDEPI